MQGLADALREIALILNGVIITLIAIFGITTKGSDE